jgi:hypothetical protein
MRGLDLEQTWQDSPYVLRDVLRNLMVVSRTVEALTFASFTTIAENSVSFTTELI